MQTSIQNQIRPLRFQHGEMTQQQLAVQIGVTRQTVNAIEAGKYSPSLEVAFRIAHTFGKPLEEVFQFKPSPTPIPEAPPHPQLPQDVSITLFSLP